MSGVLRKTALDVGGWTVNLNGISPGNESSETAVKVSVRPEEFYLSDDGEGLHGKISGSVFLGLYSQNFVRLDNGSEAEFAVDHKSTEREFKLGDRVTLKVYPEKINVFDETGTRNLLGA
jgi:iron(III) transport system ATP-binding protein